MSHYLIVGKSFKNLAAKIIERGDTFTLLYDTALPHPNGSEDRRVFVPFDFTNRETITKGLQELTQKPDGVVCIYENYVLPTAWIAETLGLPGLPVSAAEACTDKYLMRSLFQQAPKKISPAFTEVQSMEEVDNFANTYGYPVILKPANLAKSLLVTKSNDETELQRNYEQMIEQIHSVYKKYAPHRQPKIIAEEFMSGSIHSVDAFVDAQGIPHILEQVVDYQTGYNIGYDDNFHYSRILPSKLSHVDQSELRAVAALGLSSLGMRSSPAHIEIIITSEGPQIVEIGARNGGYRERMHGLANGIDMLGATLDIAIGKIPEITATRNDSCAVLELFPKQSGSFQSLSNEETLRKLTSLTYLSIKPEPGQHVGKSSEGYKMCAVIILHSQDVQQLATDLDFVREQVSVQIS